jgi:coenzyme Q-binding protein COQ10
MIRYRAARRVGHEASFLQGIVSDVERYPAFVPGCREVRLLLPVGAVRRAHVVYGISRALSFAYDCRIHEAPGWILVEGERGVFRHLHTLWRFEPAGPAACDVSFAFEADFASPALAWAGTRLLEGAAARMLEAFRRRADCLAASSPEAC